MFGELSASFCELPLEQRQAMAELLERRNEYWKYASQLNELRIKVLANPTPEAEEELREFSSVMVAPHRNSLGESITALLEQSVNIEGLQQMLPMLLMAVLQSVNIPLLFATLGIEPDLIEPMITQAKEFFSQDM